MGSEVCSNGRLAKVRACNYLVLIAVLLTVITVGRIVMTFCYWNYDYDYSLHHNHILRMKQLLSSPQFFCKNLGNKMKNAYFQFKKLFYSRCVKSCLKIEMYLFETFPIQAIVQYFNFFHLNTYLKCHNTNWNNW